MRFHERAMSANRERVRKQVCLTVLVTADFLQYVSMWVCVYVCLCVHTFECVVLILDDVIL